MSVMKPTGADLVAELSALLGQGHAQGQGQAQSQGQGLGSPASPTLHSISHLTQKQLLDAARKLGLGGVTRLKKEALVSHVWEAWQNLLSGRAAPPAEPQDPPWSHKFEQGKSGPTKSEETHGSARATVVEASKEIPWGYGRDRIAVMPVDPDRLYAYWEVLEASITKARAELGRGGAGAWLNLRVYDTTGRIFDGTNAHGTIDHRVERGDRQWFFAIGKPTSEVIIEVGMKSDEGYFVKIARSGRVEFPRHEPVAWSEPEWLTVRVATGQIERAGMRLAGRAMGAGPHGAGAGADADAAHGSADGVATGSAYDVNGVSAPPHAGVPIALRHVPWADALRFGETTFGEGHHDWQEIHVDGTVEAHRQFNWVGPATITSWEAGPFPYPVEVPEPLRETFAGKTRVFRSGARTHVVYGPWQIVIRGLGAQQSRVVVSRWEVYRSWAETGGAEGHATETETHGVVGASERRLMMAGASERRWVEGSEIRFAGASEMYFLAASELRLRGASERLFAAASELRLGGASERMLAGSSELRMGGASERHYLGASEGRLGGASEARPGGAFGAAGRFMGSSDNAYPAPPEGERQSSSSGGDGPPSTRRG